MTAQTAPAAAARPFSTRFETVPRGGGRSIRARRVRVSASSWTTSVTAGPTNCASSSGRPFATQTAPAAATTSVGVAPVASVSTAPDSEATPSNVPASASTTHRLSPAAATDAGVRPAATRRRTVPLAASIATSEPPADKALGARSPTSSGPAPVLPSPPASTAASATVSSAAAPSEA